MIWIDVASIEDFHDSAWLEIESAHGAILLLKVKDEFFAVSATCPHQSAWFSQGRLEGEHIFCPRHAGCFHLITGKRVAGPLCPDLAVYPVRVDEGRISIGSEQAKS